MTKEAFVSEVSDSSFRKYVLLNSHKVPVVVAFIGVWPEHCFVLTELAEKLSQRVAADPGDLDARFDLALCEVSRHDYERGMNQLFYIQHHAPDKEGAAREMIVSIINMLAPENPEFAQQYRRKLSGMLSK